MLTCLGHELPVLRFLTSLPDLRRFCPTDWTVRSKPIHYDAGWSENSLPGKRQRSLDPLCSRLDHAR